MKKIHLLIGLIICFGISSCFDNLPKADISSEAQQDTLLKKFVFEKFHLKKRSHRDQDINERISKSKNNNEVIIYPGAYKLKYFNLGDGFGYSPFAVKVTTLNDSLIGFFTFTDEMYYLNNEISGTYDDKTSIDIDPTTDRGYFIGEKNFETNLNKLISKLGYEKDERAVLNLVDVLFDLLDMYYVSNCVIQDLTSRLNQVKSTDKLIVDCKKEFNEFEEYLSDCRVLCGVSGHEGVYGFWQLTLERKGDIYCIRTKFIGDLIFTDFYI
jgi:hypothetical protein